MKELKPKLLFKYQEYVQSISTLLLTLYNKASDNVSFSDELEQQSFYSRYFVLLNKSMTLFLTNESKIGKKIVPELEVAYVDSFLDTLTNDSITKMSWVQFYDNFSPILEKVLLESSQNEDQNIQIIGLAMILLEGINLEENSKTELIKSVSLLIQEAMRLELKLAKNTGLAPKLMGKPSFMVLRD